MFINVQVKKRNYRQLSFSEISAVKFLNSAYTKHDSVFTRISTGQELKDLFTVEVRLTKFLTLIMCQYAKVVQAALQLK